LLENLQDFSLEKNYPILLWRETKGIRHSLHREDLVGTRKLKEQMLRCTLPFLLCGQNIWTFVEICFAGFVSVLNTRLGRFAQIQ
jgi:hypothetical protein